MEIGRGDGRKKQSNIIPPKYDEFLVDAGRKYRDSDSSIIAIILMYMIVLILS